MRTSTLLSTMLVLALAMTFTGCKSKVAGSPEAGSVKSMKGFELYSWQAEGEWVFALVVGTNRLKTVEEIASPEVRLNGLDALKRELAQLAPGEWVFWSEDRVPNTALPAVDVIREVRAFCEQRGLHLEIQAGDVRWDPSPTALVIRYYSPYTTAGLAGAFDRRYYIPEVQVWGDGRIMWTLQEGARRRVLEGQLTTGRMEALLQRLLDTGFLDWADEYQTLGGNSYPSMHLSVRFAHRSKEVSEHGGAPDGYYELAEFLTGGAGATGHDYVPARGYLSAVPGPIEAHAPPWPDGTAGITLDEVGDGRYVDGESLAFAWQLMNENPKAPVYVRSGGRVYTIMVQIPGVSYFEPPLSESSSIRDSIAEGYGLPSDQIIDLAVAPDGVLWAITAGGIGYFSGRGWKSVELDHSLGAVKAMAFAPDGSIWLGTSGGVAHVQPQPGTNRRHT